MVTLDKLLEKAIKIASICHEGQVDKAGKPYILHPLTVMESVDTLPEKILAVLHDTIEDTDLTLEDLEKEGFPDYILYFLEILTRSKDITYKEYIKKISQYKITSIVKLADLKHNTDISRFEKIDPKFYSLLKRYHWAIHYLKNTLSY